MGKMRDLFTEQPYGGLPPSVGMDTSKLAAISMSHGAATLRRKIFLFVQVAGRSGHTCDETESALGLRHQTASARIRELVLLDAIVDSGVRRRTRSGRTAAVWITRE